jgi:hypothetical protein
MIGTVIFVLSVLLLLGIAFTVYCIKMAEVDEGQIEERPDEYLFSKPEGWKVGKLTKEMQNFRKVELKEIYADRKRNSFNDLSEKFSAYRTKPSDLL